MKCLTVCQPWAWAIVHAYKRIENRTWYTAYRGPLLIHAGKSKQLLKSECADRWPMAYGITLPPEDAMDFGAIVGVAELFDCRREDDLPPEWEDHPFAQGPYCWMLRNVHAFDEPIPWRGAQGLFDVSEPHVWAYAQQLLRSTPAAAEQAKEANDAEQ